MSNPENNTFLIEVDVYQKEAADIITLDPTHHELTFLELIVAEQQGTFPPDATNSDF